MAEYSIRDIARMAGVSVGTVSRILNHAENVDEGIRRRTMEVIRQVNYRSGRRGRRAESRTSTLPQRERTHTLALISPGMGPAWKSNDLWTSYMCGIETACQERCCRLTLYMAEANREEISREIIRNTDGILIKMENPLPDYLKELITLLPAVGFGATHTFDPLPQVIVDNNAGGVIATEQLLRQGHRRIAFVNHEACNEMFIARSNGYLEVMKSTGNFRPEYLIEFSPPNREEGRAVDPEQTPPDMSGPLERLLALPERPTAVIFGNDWAAFGFLTACQTRGIRIPDEFSIVGMDDTGSLCNLLKPTLSSVAMPFNRVSHFATCTLCDLIDGIGIHQRNTSSMIRIPGVLKQRDSIKTI
ncbi:LacI family DNA-binding transcriptional regulator [uncultured Victivallis sp.]|uniref:LacI family DNA-binding transcriptional regulator n=1 Tax=uncultured Victivallis sp. TaxID=354118 RepID=UPI0025E152BC|nr:LacI family DNA-binding transcriptional regulator [uncultured Victivallis sp.]